MKNLEDQLKCSTSSKATHLYVNLDPLSNQKIEIYNWKMQIIVLEKCKGVSSLYTY